MQLRMSGKNDKGIRFKFAWNAYQTQEIPYVSEQQLKTITKDAMWIIEQIDSSHLNSAININDGR